MSRIATVGNRYLKDDVWHDDNGELPGHPGRWDPPMTDDERHIAALSDPDSPPLSGEELAGMRRVSKAKFIRRRMGLSQEEFAQRFRIPLGTLRDWEQHRSEPDPAASAYLAVIEQAPDAVVSALKQDKLLAGQPASQSP
jgi:putative transcriptional regulator